jgi:hypothetical protein
MEATVALARYFVFENDNHWVVMLDGMLVGQCPDRQEALRSAIVMADLMGSMRHDADVLVEADGRLDFAWTYGVDALPQMPAVAA